MVAVNQRERVAARHERRQRGEHLGVALGNAAQLEACMIGRAAQTVTLLLDGQRGVHRRVGPDGHADEVDEVAGDHQAPARAELLAPPPRHAAAVGDELRTRLGRSRGDDHPAVRRPIEQRERVARLRLERREVGEGRAVVVPEAQRHGRRRRIAHRDREAVLWSRGDGHGGDRRLDPGSGPLLRPEQLVLVVDEEDHRRGDGSVLALRADEHGPSLRLGELGGLHEERGGQCAAELLLQQLDVPGERRLGSRARDAAPSCLHGEPRVPPGMSPPAITPRHGRTLAGTRARTRGRSGNRGARIVPGVRRSPARLRARADHENQPNGRCPHRR